jgi:diacylglycerol kinase (ATP)
MEPWRAPLPMAKALILHNPAARNAPEPALLSAIGTRLRLAGFGVSIEESRERGDLVVLARRAAAESMDRVVICGGDGSVREVAEGLKGSPVPLALVPMGTANVLAQEMGLPTDSPSACAAIAGKGRPKPVGLGSVNGSTFTFCASAGLDSLAVARVDLLEKRQTGGWAYLHAALNGFLEAGPPGFAAVLPSGKRIEAVQVFAARAKRYAGPFALSREARIENPALRLIAVHGPFYRHLPLALLHLLLGALDEAPGVTSLDTEAFLLESAEPFPVQADGDLVAQTPASFRSEPEALTLVFPP